jgi:hypothetical protein
MTDTTAIAFQKQAAKDAEVARHFMDSAKAQLSNGEPVASVNSMKTAASYQQKSAASYEKARKALDDL